MTIAAEKTELRECEVVIRFKVPRANMAHIYAASDELAKLGITFDTGGRITDPILYGWEFDWSLTGPVKVLFKRFKENKNDNQGG